MRWMTHTSYLPSPRILPRHLLLSFREMTTQTLKIRLRVTQRNTALQKIPVQHLRVRTRQEIASVACSPQTPTYLRDSSRRTLSQFTVTTCPGNHRGKTETSYDPEPGSGTNEVSSRTQSSSESI